MIFENFIICARAKVSIFNILGFVLKPLKNNVIITIIMTDFEKLTSLHYHTEVVSH